MNVFREYLQLTKPRIVALLVFCAVIGMFLAVPGIPPWRALVFGTFGIWLASGSAAAFNHLIDERIDKLMARTSGIRVPKLRHAMNQTMSDNTFIFRNHDQLAKAVDDLVAVRREFDESAYVMDKSKTFNTDLVGALETDFLIDAALCVAKGALERKESRGAQSRTDFPERDDENYLMHTLAWRTPSDAPRLDYSRKVKITEFEPSVRTY